MCYTIGMLLDVVIELYMPLIYDGVHLLLYKTYNQFKLHTLLT